MLHRKRNKKRTLARRRGNAHHAKRRRRVHRRRGNPHLLLANPRGVAAGQLGLFDAFGHKIAAVKNIRRLAKEKSKPKKSSKRRRRAAAPVARRKGRRRYYRIYRGRGRQPKYRIYRRTNPFGSWMAMVRLGVAGGLGIVAARIGGRLYSDHVSSHVRGGAASGSMRAILDEGARIIAMGALPILVDRMALRRLPLVTAADSMAFVVGGLAEAGRQAIGVAIKHVQPTVDAAKWGLSGPAYAAYHTDGSYIYGTTPQGRIDAIGYANRNLAGLVDESAFEDGLAGIVDQDAFESGQVFDTGASY